MGLFRKSTELFKVVSQPLDFSFPFFPNASKYKVILTLVGPPSLATAKVPVRSCYATICALMLHYSFFFFFFFLASLAPFKSILSLSTPVALSVQLFLIPALSRCLWCFLSATLFWLPCLSLLCNLLLMSYLLQFCLEMLIYLGQWVAVDLFNVTL